MNYYQSLQRVAGRSGVRPLTSDHQVLIPVKAQYLIYQSQQQTYAVTEGYRDLMGPPAHLHSSVLLVLLQEMIRGYL